jgi:hypothetical protein
MWRSCSSCWRKRGFRAHRSNEPRQRTRGYIAIYSDTIRFDSIVIIESLRINDIPTGTQLFYQVLQPWAQTHGPFHVELRSANSRSAFLAILDAIRSDFFVKGHCPLIHIEAHGDENGLELGNGETIDWEELRDRFTDLNRLSRFNLVIFMAMCCGWWFSRTLTPMKPSPCWGVIGPTETVDEAPLLDAASAFYTELLTSLNAWKAVATMNQQAPANTWTYLLESAEVMYGRVCATYTRHNAAPEEIEARIDDIVAEVVRRSGYNLAVAHSARVDARRLLSNPKDVYVHFYRSFFMLDDIPENSGRFTLSYEDALKYL